MTGLVAATALVLAIAVAVARRIRRRKHDPSVVGPYVIERKLGAGAMADVFLAHHRRATTEPVALKCLRPGIPRATAMLRDEARSLASLSHRNVVRLIASGSARGQRFLALEVVDGASLAQCLRFGPLGLDAAADACHQLCEALAHVHGARDERARPLRLIHRDIKPHNVLVMRDGTIKLSDFGIASFTARRMTALRGQLKGTLRYLAPEQVRGRSYDARVDLHAVGLLWFECVVGHPFFDEGTDDEVLRQVMTRRRALPASQPVALRRIFERSAAIEPAGRFTSACALRTALAAVGDHAAGRRALVDRIDLVCRLRGPQRNDVETRPARR